MSVPVVAAVATPVATGGVAIEATEKKGNGMVLAIGGLLGAVILVVVVWYFFLREKDPAPKTTPKTTTTTGAGAASGGGGAGGSGSLPGTGSGSGSLPGSSSLPGSGSLPGTGSGSGSGSSPGGAAPVNPSGAGAPATGSGTGAGAAAPAATTPSANSGKSMGGVPGTSVTRYVGCYRDEPNRAMAPTPDNPYPHDLQEYDYARCKAYADQNGFQAFALQFAADDGKAQCWLSNNLVNAQRYGTANNCRKINGNDVGGSWTQSIYERLYP